ncbi:hypothetical protein NDU88_005295 [Pleurodeles waltl]|uniref:Uncharacterized protein n=1 Tax=Pleurodeles waltl TaxID=8319 RepID=A0AAV7LMD9_PLEWA|nr:hypothetical protein NDU88_005295 [Pleurodeles waltl]
MQRSRHPGSWCRLPKLVPVFRPLDYGTETEGGREVARSLWSRVLRLLSLPRGCQRNRTPGAAAGASARARSLTGAQPRGLRGTAGSKEPAPAREKLHEREVPSVPPRLESAV